MLIPLAAAAAFVGLFALWVILPRFILRRHENANANAAPASARRISPIVAQEDFAPQAAD